MPIHSLLSAIEQSEQAPCEKFSCPKRPQCASELLSCTAFRYFAGTGQALDPRIYVPARLTRRQHPVQTESIDPTREIYDSMQVDREYEANPELTTAEKVELVLSDAMAARPALQLAWV